MEYTCESDMASMRIETDDVAFFFQNPIGGDGAFTVQVLDHADPDGGFIGHFEVKTRAWLNSYDCGGAYGKRVHEFGPGRYPVHSNGRDTLYIGKWKS